MPTLLLVVEVVSLGKINEDRDYRFKRTEYSTRGISEYWIVDPANSDLDFWVEFSNASPKGASTRFFALRQGLEELFGRAVDLVEVQTIQNPYFLEAIAPIRWIVYGD